MYFSGKNMLNNSNETKLILDQRKTYMYEELIEGYTVIVGNISVMQSLRYELFSELGLKV